MDINTPDFLSDVQKLRERRIIVLDKEIIEATGVDKGALSAYLNGSKKPSAPFLKKFYDHYAAVLKKNLAGAMAQVEQRTPLRVSHIAKTA